MRLCPAQKRTILRNKIKIFWEMNLSFVRDEFKLRELNLCTWKRIGAQKKDVIRIFFLMCLFMRLCAAQKRTILRNKIKVFLRDEWDESLHLKTHRRTEKMTYNPNFDFGAVYTSRTSYVFTIGFRVPSHGHLLHIILIQGLKFYNF